MWRWGWEEPEAGPELKNTKSSEEVRGWGDGCDGEPSGGFGG